MSTTSAPDQLLRDCDWLQRFARALVHDRHAAEDIGQEAMLRALGARPQAPLARSWLVKVARNLVTSAGRRQRSEAEAHTRLAPPRAAPSAAELAANAELQQRALAAVLRLPEPYQRTILLRYMQGLTVSEVAAAMQVPAETVRTRQRRALRSLRTALSAGTPRQQRCWPWFVIGGGAMTTTVTKTALGVGAAAVAALCLWASWPAPTGRAPAAEERPPAHTLHGDEGARPTTPTRTAVPAAQAPAPAPADATAASTATLTIRAIWLDRGPAADLDLLLRGPNQRAGRRATTDSSGVATFSALAPGTHRLCSFANLHEEKIELSSGDHLEHVVFLEPETEIGGVVVDPDGRPVPGAELIGVWGGTDPQWVYRVGRTDDAGRFTVRGLRSVSQLGARHPHLGTSGLAVIAAQRRGDAAPRPLRLELPGSAAAVRGRVLDPRGRPLAGVWVRLGEYGRIKRDAHGQSLQEPNGGVHATDADGTFAVNALAPGNWRLRVFAAGFAPLDRQLRLEPHTTRSFELALQPGGAVHGSVRGGGGAPIEGVEVEVEGGWYPATTRAHTDEDGAFQLASLAAGEVLLTFSAAGQADATRVATVVAGSTQHIDVTMTAGHVLSGRLIDEHGQPLAGWAIRAEGQQRGTKTARDGTFSLDAVAMEPLTLVVRERMGFEPERTRFSGILPGAPVELTVSSDTAPSAWLTGTATDPRGQPLAGVSITVSQRGWPLPGLGVRTDATGQFRVGPLPPGQYTVAVAQADWRSPDLDVEVRAAEERTLGAVIAAPR